MSVDKKEIRKELKRVAELASGERLQASIQEYRDLTGDEPLDCDLEFWHAGYKHGAQVMVDCIFENFHAATDAGAALQGRIVEVAQHNGDERPEGTYVTARLDGEVQVGLGPVALVWSDEESVSNG